MRRPKAIYHQAFPQLESHHTPNPRGSYQVSNTYDQRRKSHRNPLPRHPALFNLLQYQVLGARDRIRPTKETFNSPQLLLRVWRQGCANMRWGLVQSVLPNPVICHASLL